MHLSQIIRSTFAGIGELLIGVAEEVGKVLLMFWEVARLAIKPPFRYGELTRQLDFLGVQSVPLIVFTGAFTGMVSALQTHHGFNQFGALSLVGATVALGLTRELGPVLSALMVIARAVSSMTSELGSMRNSQQIDALWIMAVNPIHYLVVPRVLAMIVCLPLLGLIFSFSGMVGAYLLCMRELGVDEGTFWLGVQKYLVLEDITHGLKKSLVFGLVISLVGCSEGYNAPIGARGVGYATTRSVVISSVLVLALDYLMTAFMFH